MKLVAIEEHFLTADIRAAWASSAIGQEGTAAVDRGEIEERLDDLGERRIADMDEAGVAVQVLSVTTPALHNLEPEESVAIAREEHGSRRLPAHVRNRRDARRSAVRPSPDSAARR